MTKRKKYVLDRGFQLRATFSILGVVALVSMVIITMITSGIIYNNNKIDNIYQIEENIFNIMQSTALSSDSFETKKQRTDALLKNHNTNLDNIKQIAMYSKYMLLGLIIFIILQVVFLYGIVLRMTHKISGPIYVISRYIKEILNGEKAALRPLRNKDELKDFYKLFCDLARYIENLKK